MKIIKRNGSEEIFNRQKISNAIRKANTTVEEKYRLTEVQVDRIVDAVILSCEQLNRTPSVEEIQDMVEDQIMAHGAFELANHYITYL